MITKDQCAIELAQMHYQVEDGITTIIRFTNDREALPGEPIKLLEVNENTVPAGIMPLFFAPLPARGILFPSVIVEVTPDEFRALQLKEISLPNGWSHPQELRREVEACI